ncbi:MAG TPA: hypothetical protein VGP72_12250 [Planctomycetota bacterium]|jgi:hypothetical protein
MNWRVVGALLLVAWHANAEEPAKADNVLPDIPVVTRYEDLLRLQPVKLDNGATARFGIEAKTCPRWSGVLLYCLTEGYVPPIELRDYEILCGPLRVETFHQDSDTRARRLGGAASIQRHGDLKGAKLLFIKTLAFGRAGKWEVAISAPDRKTLAKITLDVAEKESHPWVRLGRQEGLVDKLEPVSENNGERHAAVGIVSVVADGIAVPHWDGLTPIVAENADKKIQPGDQLPSLIPSEAAPSLKLTVGKESPQGKAFSISGEKPFLACRPDWHFIARWWVNGKTFMPKVLKPYSDANGMVFMDKQLDLFVELHPERLGAKKGDRVGLQLLYTAPGWMSVSETSEHLWAASDPDETEPVRITNRVEFEVP